MAHPFFRIFRNFGLRLRDRSLFPAEKPYLPLNGSRKFTLWFHSNLHNAVTGGPTWIRTRDRPVMSRWLCQLSYGPFASTSRIMISIPFNDLLSPGILFIYGPQSSLSREISPRLLSPRRATSIPFSQLQRCHQLSIKLLSFLRRLGCRSFLRALASICRMRSLVTRKSWPTSSRV